MITSPVFWLFGRSAAGKTTLAERLVKTLRTRKKTVVHLDGDILRSSVCSDLGFNAAARLENHRRIAQFSRILSDQGIMVIASTMAPEHSQRDLVKSILGERLVWLFIHASPEVCAARDPKGIYQKAREGTVSNFTDYPYDLPRAEECRHLVDTTTGSIEQCSGQLLQIVAAHSGFSGC
jgi:adenylyl-sulfate kinase